MRLRLPTVSTLSLAVLLSGGALAEPGAADARADAYDLAKVGEARLEFMFWSVYDSRLYAPDGEYEPGVRPLRLEIEYLLDISREDLVKRTAKEWKKLAIENPARDRWLGELRTLWPDVSKNDVLALRIDDDGRSTFFHNGERLGVIDDPAFGKAFTDIWLSPETSRPDIRLSLLGKATD